MLDQLIDFFRVVIPTNGEKVILSVGAWLGAWLGLAIGGYSQTFYILCGFILADYVTGTTAAFRTGKWKSTDGFNGLFKKMFILLMVIIAHWVDEGMHVNFLREAVMMAYILNEAGSVLENLNRMGYGKLIPEVLKNGLAQIQEQKKERFGNNE